ncbi:hypothetical protein HYPSUDRAFT_207010 [Hypholoma sublateritium FD-334 SS-4]|uniref:Uncharacterized protein n=1 Tax=Hypholoma sublateritium (strain FD-334 SS-4) TaxID=945553 RepID=A0A0D2P7Q9_HYPSF|nr:hypothetical protein HYPSUDRAFT_207010 [Hypholoma sublateritium FD-334 SS-4]
MSLGSPCLAKGSLASHAASNRVKSAPGTWDGRGRSIRWHPPTLAHVVTVAFPVDPPAPPPPPPDKPASPARIADGRPFRDAAVKSKAEATNYGLQDGRHTEPDSLLGQGPLFIRPIPRVVPVFSLDPSALRTASALSAARCVGAATSRSAQVMWNCERV